LLQPNPAKNTLPEDYISNIEKEIASLPSKSLPLDKAYDQNDFLFELVNNSFAVSAEQFQAQTV
jgi:hypothetical protein